MPDLEKNIKSSLKKLEKYLDTTNLKGYDPYDALNSKFLKLITFNKRLPGIVFTQALKRLPINLRPLLLVKKDYNPKGLGLFLTGYVKLYRLYKEKKCLQKINHIISLLEKLRSTGYSGYCWGYNFPWQNKLFLWPGYTPTVVNTAFVAHAFLDTYELLGKKRLFEIARSSCNFILQDLFILKCNDSVCFSYTPFNKSKIHNANVLAAGLLARVYSISKEEKLLEYAQKSIKFTIDRQRENGSWYYGETVKNEGLWYKGENGTDYENDEGYAGAVNYIDNFHTGFVLESLWYYTKYTGDQTYVANIKKGLEFFESNLFLEDGTSKYFFNSVYPIDIHSSAQAIVTFVKLNIIKEYSQTLDTVTQWMIKNMQDKRGYFYYRKGKYFRNKIPYIRWSQAWCFHALTTYLFDLHNNFNKGK